MDDDLLVMLCVSNGKESVHKAEINRSGKEEGVLKSVLKGRRTCFQHRLFQSQVRKMSLALL